MQLNTRHFGQLEIDEKNIIDFPEGLPGFENAQKFVLIAGSEEILPFQWLQCVNIAELAFVVVDPKFFKPDYIIDINDDEVESLEIKDVNSVIVLCIVVVPDDVSQITANLKAPLLINTTVKRGKQVILENRDYKIKHYIFQELKQREDEVCAGSY
ncbi:MAG: flagellar assembly protein FliW [Bacillota bacterium]|nr:flagellar assembly protein FliW [Bacillota bacterium]